MLLRYLLRYQGSCDRSRRRSREKTVFFQRISTWGASKSGGIFKRDWPQNGFVVLCAVPHRVKTTDKNNYFSSVAPRSVFSVATQKAVRVKRAWAQAYILLRKRFLNRESCGVEPINPAQTRVGDGLQNAVVTSTIVFYVTCLRY